MGIVKRKSTYPASNATPAATSTGVNCSSPEAPPALGLKPKTDN